MNPRGKSEKGQVLVVMVLGIVALLGFAALAVDGGMFYLDRRTDQNAADDAALAGAQAAGEALLTAGVGQTDFDCTDSDVLAAIAAAESGAMASAAAHGFSIDTDISDNHGVQVTCEDSGGSTGKYLDVEVWIQAETETSFAHLIFAGGMLNTVDAVTRLSPGLSGPFAAGYAILALRPTCDNKLGGIQVNGGINMYVETGKIFSNACIDADGNSGRAESKEGIYYYTTLSDKHNVFYKTPNLPPQQAAAPIELEMDPLDSTCAALPLGSVSNCGSKVCMTHGRYSSYKNTGNKDLVLEPGLYCFTDAFEANNGSVTIDSAYSDEEGVTFYLYKTGSFQVVGNSINVLRAPKVTAGVSITNGAVPGLLIQMDEGNTHQVDFGGNAGSYFRGTIFAPEGIVDFGGNSDMNGTQAVQVIAGTIILHGNPGVTVHYEDDDIYQHGGYPILDFYR